MIARSLRLRLIAFAAIAIAIALWAAWHVMGRLFEHYTEQRMAITLTHQGNALIAATRIGADGRPQVDASDLEARFRRRASGLYWEVIGPGGAARSPWLGGTGLAADTHHRVTAAADWRKTEIPGPYETDLILVERSARIGSVTALVRVGEDDEPIDRARDSFAYEMGMFLLALGIALALAAWAQVELGLLPLRKVRRELAAMERHPGQRLGDGHPHEIDSLVRAINALADARDEDLVRARRRAADLAHALKTPLAALAAQSRLARAAGAGEAADAIDQTLASAGAALEAEMARARAAANRGGPATGVSRPGELLESLFAVLERTEAGANLVFDSDVPAGWSLAIEGDTLAEIFGNLLDNAARHARRIVQVRAAAEPSTVRFDIADDGPGIPADKREIVLRRGMRLDEAGSGHGLGLAIVADLIDATGGTLMLGNAAAGGLLATIRWPIAILTIDPPPTGWA
jgi:signal transduction histidine kinase